jgi:hypothetical protein
MSDLTDTSETETTPTSPPADAGGTEALDQAAKSIRDAKDAEGHVAANDDITTRDDDRAGEHSEDPDGTGGHP